MQNPQNLWLYGVAISLSRTWFFLDVSRSLINILLKHLFTIYVYNWLLYYCMCGYVGCSYKWALFPNAHRGFLSLNQQALPAYELIVEFFKISHKMLNGKKRIVWNSCSVITQSSNWMPPRKIFLCVLLYKNRCSMSTWIYGEASRDDLAGGKESVFWVKELHSRK